MHQLSISFTQHLKENALKLFDLMTDHFNREDWEQMYQKGNFRETNDRKVFAFDLMISNHVCKGPISVSFSNWKKDEPYTIHATIWKHSELIQEFAETPTGRKLKEYRRHSILFDIEINHESDFQTLLAELSKIPELLT